MSTIRFDCKKFVCAICQNYLSKAPIYLVEDNRDLCSNCVFGNSEIAFRNVSLENLLVNAYFPCKNVNQGCRAISKFGEKDTHSFECDFNLVQCPLCKKSECEWKGTFGEVCDHVREKHDDLISRSDSFTINMNDNAAADTFVVLNNKHCFVINYEYNSSDEVLKYSVVLLNSDEEQTYQIKLKDPSGSLLVLEEHQAVCFRNDLSQLALKEMIRIEEIKPASNIVTLVITFMAPQDLGDSTNLVKSDSVNFFKCGLCHENLRLPIFGDAKSPPICRYCYCTSREQAKYKMVPLDNELSCLLAKENDSCRHKYCDKIVGGTSIVNHERSCPFRMYKCFVCNKSLLYSITKDHYGTLHGDATYFEQQYEFVMKAKTSVSCYTLFLNEIINVHFFLDSFFQIDVRQSGVLPNYSVIIELHCTNKQLNAPPLKYILNASQLVRIRIEAHELLACFQTEIGMKIYLKKCNK